MKNLKRILCVGLCCALALGMGVLAAAADNPYDDPYAPIITKQPKATQYICAGKDITLEVQARLPDGVEGTLSYAWYDATAPYSPISTDAKFVLTISKNESLGSKIIYVVVTNTYNNDEGEERKASTTSSTIEISIAPTLLNYLSTIWQLKWMPEDSSTRIRIIATILFSPSMLVYSLFYIVFYPFILLRSLST